MTPRVFSDWRSRLIFLYAAVVGFLLWALSPMLFGVTEPWDAPYPAYVFALVFAGIVAGLFASELVALVASSYFGVWLGQVLALAVLPSFEKGWLLLGVMTTGIGSLLLFVGSVVGWAVGKTVRGNRAV